MKSLTRFPLENGGFLVVEEDDPTSGGRAVQVSRLDDIPEAGQSLEKAVDKIKPAAEAVLARLRSLAVKPDEVSIEFGVKLSGRAGAFIAATAAEANFQVSLKWTAAQEGGRSLDASFAS